MVGIVIVSHSAKVAEGIVDLASEMASENSHILAAGGMEESARIPSAFRQPSKQLIQGTAC